jgi:probable addiction module antidote protein
MAKHPQSPGKPEEIAKRLSKALERDPAAFTSALMALIKQRGMTAMAKQTGVSRHTLYRYEWGDDRPLLETVVKMTAACGFKLMVVPDHEPKAPGRH